MTPRRELIFKVMDGEFSVLPYLHHFNHYERCDSMLWWLVMNGIRGKEFLSWLTSKEELARALEFDVKGLRELLERNEISPEQAEKFISDARARKKLSMMEAARSILARLNRTRDHAKIEYGRDWVQ